MQESYHNIVSDTYKVQTRVQAKAQANAPTVVNTQLVAQKATPKIVKLPIKTKSDKDIKMPPSGIIHQPPKGIVIPLGAQITPIVMPPNVRPSPKPPNVDKATTRSKFRTRSKYGY